jgi:hypothetical protein
MPSPPPPPVLPSSRVKADRKGNHWAETDHLRRQTRREPPRTDNRPRRPIDQRLRLPDFFTADFFAADFLAAGFFDCLAEVLAVFLELTFFAFLAAFRPPKMESQPAAYFSVEPTRMTDICVALSKKQ